MPWEDGVTITPLPEVDKPAYLEALIADAVKKGGEVVNKDESHGGSRHGALFIPALLYPVNKDMRIFHEEQFGPVVPIAVYDEIEEVIQVAKHSWNGQQVCGS